MFPMPGSKSKPPARTASAGGASFQPLTAVAAANALTFTLAAGAVLNFNDGTSVTLGAAITLTVPNTALMGTVNGLANRLWVAAMKNGGTPELAARNNVSGTSLLGIDLGGTITSTIMDVAADNAQVWYSTTARAAQPFCVVGYVDSTQAAAGVWASSPTKTQGFGPGVPMPGQVLQEVSTQTGAVATGTTAIPYDDTIPQVTEGDQYLTQTIVGFSASNLMRAYAKLLISNTNIVRVATALFQDGAANALAVGYQYNDTNSGERWNLIDFITPGKLGSTTFTVRGGGSTGATTTFNGQGGGREYGGVINSLIKVEEISA